MKKYILPILLIFSFIYSTNAVEDTLSYWASGTNLGAYTDASITMQWAHFYPEAPCSIKQVIVWFYGNAGTANMYIVGQEAGSSVPEVIINSDGVPLWGRNGLQFQAQPTTATATGNFFKEFAFQIFILMVINSLLVSPAFQPECF
ncbi:hypothetical protein ACFLSQ_07935 [Bacteroidota bacterium]